MTGTGPSRAVPAGPAGGSPSGSRFSTAMLDDLLNNPLDPGYRLAFQDRQAAEHGPAGGPPPAGRRWWDGPLLWLACLAVGLLLVVAYQQQHQSAPAREAARKDLIDRIERLQQTGDSLDDRAKVLASEVAGLRDAQLPGNSEELKRLELASGALPATGPGVRIELDEPPAPTPAATGRPGTTPQEQVAVLHDRDIRAVVNQLWAAGAEAVAVNGLRLTATSFIRFAGESVLVDFQPISAPYTIEAIGNRNALLVAFADSPIARQLKTMAAVDGITFRFTGKSGLRLQSVTVAQPHYAGLGPATSGQSPSPSASESPR
ncbi:DUF881 domain-containing protein [Jatrophihabitans sp.]|uniref:DUF881 domain-containing protein n=1 Tax=Jatrophihabitans sp. TaxID=1932789 RepID=UPI002BA2C087|nr:DUF881 domain-containing protein [Jatrophihabitans sp.]